MVVVVPSCAVTRTLIVFEPTDKESAPDAEPEETGAYAPAPTLTSIVALAWVRVGVTVTDKTEFLTDAL